MTRFVPPPRFIWPENHQCAAMLCFDVDGETTALSEDPALARRRTLMSQCEYGPRVGVPRLLGLLAHLEVPATFFVPAYIAENHPRMIEAIVAAGHEIGLHGYLHEKLACLSEPEEEAILVRSIEILTRLTGSRPVGYRAPWFEINPWTPALLARHNIAYCASEMGDDVPYFHENGLVEIPGQWMLEDWEQFAFNADPAWGFIPENCEKVFDLWWREFDAMHDLGCCFVLTLHPWLSGRPSRVRLLKDLVNAMRQKGNVWFARGNEIATWFRTHPESRRELDFDSTLNVQRGQSSSSAGTTSPSPLRSGDLSRLGSGERNPAEGGGPRGPSERERASQQGRGEEALRVHGETSLDVRSSKFDVRCSQPKT